MIARIHRKISHPAATSNVPTIKSVAHQEAVVVFRRPCRLEGVACFVRCDDDVPRALAACRGSGEAVVMRYLIPERLQSLRNQSILGGFLETAEGTDFGCPTIIEATGLSVSGSFRAE